jgi:hypothetical protein
VLQPGSIVTNTHFPQLEALVADTGSGVEPLSVEASLSGVPVTLTYAALTGRLWYTGTAFLPNGSYTYTLSARDTSGNPIVYVGAFTVAVPAPAVLGVDPPVLPRGVTTTVTITGQNFAYPPIVQVDGNPVADTGYQGLAAITLTTPITLTNGPHDVAVTAPDGQIGVKSAAFEVVEPSALEPQSPAVSANRLNNGVQLLWPQVTTSTQGYTVPVDHYEVYRSASPYFAPDGPDSVKLADVPAPVSGSGVSYTDTQAFEQPLTDYFYVVVAVNRWGLASSVSNRVAAFNFALTPGGD